MSSSSAPSADSSTAAPPAPPAGGGPALASSSEELTFRALAESLPQLVWSTTPDGYHDYYNARWHEYTGMPREGAQGWNWKNFLHADDYDRAVERWQHSLRTGEPYEIEYRFKRADDGVYRWFLGRALPVRDDTGRIVRWFGTCTDIDDHKRREELLAFLAEAGDALAASLEIDATLATVARLAVPRLADWCAVDLRDDRGLLRRLAVAHVDPTKVALARDLHERYPPDPAEPGGAYEVLRTGRPILVPEIPAGLLEELARDAEHLQIIRELRLCSYVVVPLTVGDEVLGAISIVSSDSRRRLGEEDLSIAMELARRSSIALAHAQLYDETVRAQERLEQQAAELELQNEQLQEQSVELEVQAAQLQEQAVELAASNDALVEANGRLLESEERLTLAMSGGQLGWWEWDIRDGRILWSAELEAIYGLAPGGFDGTMARYVELVHPDDRAALEQAVTTTLETRAPSYRVRHRIRHADGGTRWIDGHARLVLDASGAPARLVGVATDVSDAVQASDEREALLAAEQAARQEAESANRAKADFLATMSHELRTPLNAIAGYTDLLSLGVRGPMNDAQLEDLQRVKKSAQHLLGLINDVLNFARLEAGQVDLQIGRVSMQEVFAFVEPLVLPQVHEKGLHISFDDCDDALVARGDGEKVRQILLNLLSNAVKFTPAGGRVGVACGAKDGRVWIEVSDTGRGIAAERLETVFEPFIQIDRHLTRESQQGVGLGLAISRDLARAMGGELTASSTVEEGSIFRLELPADA